MSLQSTLGAGGYVTRAYSGVRDYLVDVAFGRVLDHRRVLALGHNPQITTGGGLPADVWTGGGLYPWMTAANSLEVVSDSANDTVAGTGARTIAVACLDANYEEFTATATLNGVGAVALPRQALRINGATVLTAGSVGTNVGNISIRTAGGGTVRAIIPAAYGVTRQSQFTVPAGYEMVSERFVFAINRPSTARDCTVATFVRNAAGAHRMGVELSVDGNPFTLEVTPAAYVGEKEDFGFRCTYVSATNTDLTAAMVGILRKINAP